MTTEQIGEPKRGKRRTFASLNHVNSPLGYLCRYVAITMVSPDRIRAMEEAIAARNLKKVRLYLKAGVPADHVYAPSHGWTFANLAARVGDADIFNCLIDAGADITFHGGFLGSMIRYAVCTHDSAPEIVDRVLADGACQQADLNSTLLYAPHYASTDNVRKLLQAGADPSYTNDDGATPLMHAVLDAQSEIALLLLNAGATTDVRIPYEDHYKKSLIRLAEERGMSDLFAPYSDPTPQPAELPEFQSVQQALSSIADWFTENATDVQLQRGVSDIQLPHPISDSPFTEDILGLYATCDGSSAECVVPTPSDNDTSYYLMSFAESLADREMMLELSADFASDETPEAWSPTWLPIASNGAGDYLVWEATTNNVLRFSHETRTAPLRSNSLLDLFQDIAHGLQTGKYTYSSGKGVA